jgi:hypothetical protein
LSSAPSSTASSTPSSPQNPTISRQKDRQRMLGSMPRSSTTSRSTPGGLATDSLVVGQVMGRSPFSRISTIGRVTWKS